ncbi:MAG: DUF433 domain-containing protein [Chloroflexi bacterium]|nr:DUF433 domain-containing protein [Chloroflexota bacterium]
MTLEELLKEYEGSLTPAQLFDALSYYYDHPGEIDQYVAENNAALGRGPQIEFPTDHPRIYKNPRIHRGEPIIQGTKVTVRNIIEQTRAGSSPEEIVEQYAQLELAQVYDALAYYYDHPAEMERYLGKEDEPAGQTHHVSS